MWISSRGYLYGCTGDILTERLDILMKGSILYGDMANIPDDDLNDSLDESTNDDLDEDLDA